MIEGAKPILWKYDSVLGIAYFCPNCKVFLCGNETKCISCNQKIDWNNKQKHNGKVRWE